MSKFYITTAIDYINGAPHIGHSYEKVASDVLARFHKLQGEQVFFLTGTDEHGAKVAQAAEKAGKSEQAFADEIVEEFKSAWKALDVDYDRFVRTTDEDHIKTVQALLAKIKDAGYLYEDEYEGLYCTGHEAFLTEKELVDGVCPEHQTKPELIKEKNWFFKVSAFTDEIKKRIEDDEFKIWPSQRRNEVLAMLEQGFNDIAISRPNVKWGIPLPWDESQTIYVWIDALINYISGIGFTSDKEQFKQFWPADWHVVGKDIIKFHCIIWPAMLLAAGIEMPKGVLAHGYLTMNGQKMSKSLGNVISPQEWTLKYGSDAVRYLLMREVPFSQDGDLSEEKLRGRYEGDLANGLGNLVSRLTNMIEKYSGGEVEIIPGKIALEEVDELTSNFHFHEALQKIWESVALANAIIDKSKPWELFKTDPEKVKTILAELAAQVVIIGRKLAPYMPETAEKIRKIFEGEKIIKAEPLFPKVE